MTRKYRVNGLCICVDLTDHLGYGREKRREGNQEILAGNVTFRRVFSSNLPYNILTLVTIEMLSEKCSRASLRTDTPSKSANRFCATVSDLLC